jgi:hypothetical protein
MRESGTTAETPVPRKLCDWCGGPLLKHRKGVLVSFAATSSTNNDICDACWAAHCRRC